MSVIIATIAENTAILAADRRMVNLATGEITSESKKKIFALNNHVAFTACGNAGVAKAIQLVLQHGNKAQRPGVVDNETIDGFCEAVDHCVKTTAMHIKMDADNVFAILILAGKDSKGNAAIKWRTTEDKAWGTIEYQPHSVIFRVFNPSDLALEQCNEIVSKHIKAVRGTNYTIPYALQSAIREIAIYSSAVNSHADIWISAS